MHVCPDSADEDERPIILEARVRDFCLLDFDRKKGLDWEYEELEEAE